MWRLPVLALTLAIWGGGVAACPGMGFLKDELSVTARQLMTPRVATVRAGGTVPLGECAELPGVGNIPFDPNVSLLYVPDRKRMDLELRAEGDCDPVLLVRGPSGRFFFDDDDGGARNARIRLAQPPAARYPIGVGSQGRAACPPRLTLQTFRGVTRYAEGSVRRPG